MNNLFIEGPVQTGKSTTIRKALRDVFGPDLNGVAGFTSQRVTDSNGQLLGFRLAPADAEISLVADPASLDNVFKHFTPKGPRIDLGVFESSGAAYLTDALKTSQAGQTKVILLDEIGGHEMRCAAFRTALYELLDSEYPCIGVVKSKDNTKRMDPTLLTLNEKLHAHLSVSTELNAFELSLRQFLDTIL